MDQLQKLLEAKDVIIEKQQEQIALLADLAEQRRLAHFHQSKELAELRRYHHVNNNRWGFLMFMLLGDVWPFNLFWS